MEKLLILALVQANSRCLTVLPLCHHQDGVIGFTRTLATDVGRYNINANVICPGGHEEKSLELAQGRAEMMNRPFDKGGVSQQIQTVDPKADSGGSMVCR